MWNYEQHTYALLISIKVSATPPGVSHRTPLARGEFCPRSATGLSSPLARGVPAGRGVAKNAGLLPRTPVATRRARTLTLVPRSLGEVGTSTTNSRR